MLTGTRDVFQTTAILRQNVRSVPYHRAPRASEIIFLRKLMSGEQSFSGGPLGCCLKRGWCERIMSGHSATITYIISEKGRCIVELYDALRA